MNRFILAFAFFGILWAAPAQAAEPKSLGTFGDWQAFSFEEPNGRVCYALTRPTATVIKPKEKLKRGQMMLQITHRPAENTRNTISYVAGYSLKNDNPVALSIDKQEFTLFVNGDTAWAKDSAADATIVKALRAGKISAVTGQSKKLTITDTISLTGASAAIGAINKACGLGK